MRGVQQKGELLEANGQAGGLGAAINKVVS